MTPEPKDKGEKDKPGWDTPDGQRVQPDEKGRWPGVATDEKGNTVVAGGDPGPSGNPDQV